MQVEEPTIPDPGDPSGNDVSVDVLADSLEMDVLVDGVLLP